VKKICTFILLVLIFFAVDLPILAENASLPQNNKPKIITCDEKSTDEMCKALEISKTEIKLRSYLKDGGVLKVQNMGPKIKYKAYVYTIKNNSDKTIFIKKLQRRSPCSLIREVIPTRIAWQLIGILLIPISAITIVGPIFLVPLEAQSIILAPFRDTAAIIESTQFKQYHYPIEIKPGKTFQARIFAPSCNMNFTCENQEYSVVNK